MNTHTFTSGDESIAERRLLKLAEMPQINADDVRKAEGAMKNERQEKQGASSSQQSSEELLASLKKTTTNVLEEYTTKFHNLPQPVHDRLLLELNQFIEREAKCAAGQETFAQVRENVEKQVRGVLESLFGGQEEGKNKAEMEAKQKKLEAERKARTIETVQRHIEKREVSMETIFESRVNTANLQDPHPGKIAAELQTFEKNQATLQESQADLQHYAHDVQDFHEKAKDQLKSIQEPPIAASVAGGAAGAAIGVWFFGIGAVPGAIVGAAAGYCTARIANHFITEKEGERKAQELNARIDTAKKRASARHTVLVQMTKQQDDDAGELGKVPGRIQGRQTEEYEKHSQQYAQAQDNTTLEIDSRGKDLADLRDNQAKLKTYGQELSKRDSAIGRQRAELTQGRIDVRTRQSEVARNAAKADAAIKQAESALERARQGGDPEAERKINEQIDRLRKGRDDGRKGAQEMDKTDAQMSEGDRHLFTSLTENAGKREEISTHERQLETSAALIRDTLPLLEEQGKSLEAGRLELTKSHGEQLDVLGKISSEISGNLLQANVLNAKTGMETAAATQSIQALPLVESPSFWQNLWNGTIDGMGHAFKFVLNDTVGHGLDWLSEKMKVVPVLGHIVSFPIDVISGVIHGAGEMCEGIATMLSHPLDTGAGMLALFGRNPQNGEWSWETAGKGWLEMGKALVSWNDFEKGDVGKGVGKIALNVIMTATGMEAAGAGATAAKTAYLMARTNGVGIAKSSMKASLAGVKAAGKSIGDSALKAGKAVGGNALEDATKMYKIARHEGKTFSQAAYRAGLTGVETLARDIETNVYHLAKLPGEILATGGRLLKAPKSIYEYLKTPKLTHLKQGLEHQWKSFGDIERRINECKIGGRAAADIPQLAGKSAEQIGAMTGAELIAAGITDARSLRELRQYRKLIPQLEDMEAAVRMGQRLVAEQIILEEKQVASLAGKKLEKSIASNPRLKAAEKQLRTQLSDPSLPLEDMSYVQNQYKQLGRDAGLSETEVDRLLKQFNSESMSPQPPVRSSTPSVGIQSQSALTSPSLHERTPVAPTPIGFEPMSRPPETGRNLIPLGRTPSSKMNASVHPRSTNSTSLSDLVPEKTKTQLHTVEELLNEKAKIAPVPTAKPKNLEGLPVTKDGNIYVLGKSSSGEGYEILARTKNGWQVQHNKTLKQSKLGPADKLHDIDKQLDIRGKMPDETFIGREQGVPTHLLREPDGTFHLRVSPETPRVQTSNVATPEKRAVKPSPVEKPSVSPKTPSQMHVDELTRIDRKLEGLRDATRSGDPAKLQELMDGVNARMANRLTREKFKVLDGTRGDGLVILDGDGMMRVVPPNEIDGFLKSAREYSRKNGRNDIVNIANHAEEARQLIARELVGAKRVQRGLPMELKQSEYDAIMKAHEIKPTPPATTYGPKELRVKAKILREAGFEMSEIDELMRAGVAGESAAVIRSAERTAAVTATPKAPKRTEPVPVRSLTAPEGDSLRRLSADLRSKYTDLETQIRQINGMEAKAAEGSITLTPAKDVFAERAEGLAQKRDIWAERGNHPEIDTVIRQRESLASDLRQRRDAARQATGSNSEEFKVLDEAYAQNQDHLGGLRFYRQHADYMRAGPDVIEVVDVLTAEQMHLLYPPGDKWVTPHKKNWPVIRYRIKEFHPELGDLFDTSRGFATFDEWKKGLLPSTREGSWAFPSGGRSRNDTYMRPSVAADATATPVAPNGVTRAGRQGIAHNDYRFYERKQLSTPEQPVRNFFLSRIDDLAADSTGYIRTPAGYIYGRDGNASRL